MFVVALFVIASIVVAHRTVVISCNRVSQSRDKWLPVTTAWRVFRLRMKERPPVWRVAANILNKQSRTADKGWCSSLGVGLGAKNSLP